MRSKSRSSEYLCMDVFSGAYDVIIKRKDYGNEVAIQYGVAIR